MGDQQGWGEITDWGGKHIDSDKGVDKWYDWVCEVINSVASIQWSQFQSKK